ncbi:MAG: 2,3-bisphosphoglycerate-independent phosphoglycerate mutase [Methanobacteriaceae archaeon]|nr:2,3-bisphosphoglycerate-independent phosphoglycerate mutase [Methanobacteriaceae archaeon]
MKGIILIMDGMGDRPIKELGNQTPLQAANTPNMNEMVKNGITGIMDSIAPGIIPGSDTAHLSILGYDPYVVYTGRGPFEATGVNIDVEEGDIAFRCNFSTRNEEGIVTDRRAGRIRDKTEELAKAINSMKLEDYPNLKIIFKESTGYRSVLVIRDSGLSDKVSDADPKVDGKKVKKIVPLDDTKEAKKTADILNQIIEKSYTLLKDHPVNIERIKNNKDPANVIIPRGAGAVPTVEKINSKYNINSACIAETGLIMGICRLAGMDIVEMEGVTGGIDTNLEVIRDTILDKVKNSEHDFFLVNIDGADEAGHDGMAKDKKEFIEKVDEVVMSEIKNLEDVYIFLTADHSTPVSVMNHSGDSVPVLIKGPEIRVDDVEKFSEIDVAKGGLCRIRGSDVMNIMMDLIGNSEKFGA